MEEGPITRRREALVLNKAFNTLWVGGLGSVLLEKQKNGGFFGFFLRAFSTLLHLPLLRFH